MDWEGGAVTAALPLSPALEPAEPADRAARPAPGNMLLDENFFVWFE